MPQLPFILHYIKEKQALGHSLLILICGETNSGKSITALSLACFFYKKFNPYKNLYFDVDKFLIHLYGSRKETLIIDEANKHLDSLKWWDKFNLAFSMAVNTQRERNNLYIVVLPIAKHLASQHRDMADVLFVMREQGIAYCYIIKKRFGEFRDIKLRPVFVGVLRIFMPPEDIEKKYHIREVKDKQNILEEAINQVLPKRVCICGKKIDYLCKSCPWCAHTYSIDIKRLDKIVNKEEIYNVRN